MPSVSTWCGPAIQEGTDLPPNGQIRPFSAANSVQRLVGIHHDASLRRHRQLDGNRLCRRHRHIQLRGPLPNGLSRSVSNSWPRARRSSRSGHSAASAAAFESRSIPDGPADEEAIARLRRTTMTLALLIYAAVAEFFMSGASREVPELAPSRPTGGHLAVSSANSQGPVAYAVKFHITRSETD